MLDWTLLIAWVIYFRKHYRAYRFAYGGVWVHFDDNSWIRCKWYYPQGGQYLRHPQDGGMFSIKLKNIITIENYSHGHGK